MCDVFCFEKFLNVFYGEVVCVDGFECVGEEMDLMVKKIGRGDGDGNFLFCIVCFCGGLFCEFFFDVDGC